MVDRVRGRVGIESVALQDEIVTGVEQRNRPARRLDIDSLGGGREVRAQQRGADGER